MCRWPGAASVARSFLSILLLAAPLRLIKCTEPQQDSLGFQSDYARRHLLWGEDARTAAAAVVDRIRSAWREEGAPAAPAAGLAAAVQSGGVSGQGQEQAPTRVEALAAALARAQAHVQELSSALQQAQAQADAEGAAAGGATGDAADAAAVAAAGKQQQELADEEEQEPREGEDKEGAEQQQLQQAGQGGGQAVAGAGAEAGAAQWAPAVPPPPLAAPANSSCAPGCATHGVCNEELARCDCPRHWMGPDCLTRNPDIGEICATYGFTLSTCRAASPCFNSCNGRGKCVSGICHCTPGFWGMDCALSRGPDGSVVLLEGQDYRPRNSSIKFYVYELPPNVTSWFNIRRLDRPLHLLFWQRLTSGGLRTTNGSEADYFFIPLNTRTLALNDHTKWVLRYVRSAWPFWEQQDHGQRHLIIHTGDLGLHEYHPVVRQSLKDEFANITWMTHWGIHTYHPVAKWYPAHRPGKDLVIPVMITTQGFELSPLNPKVEAKLRKRNKYTRAGTFFFAGRICGDRKPPNPTTRKCGTNKRLDYSGGVRQQVYFHHHNQTGFKVVPGTSSYLQDISSHKFCLAPTGGGHGKRNVLVSLMGCIPVTITDGVHQPFEPELSWAPFSVPVPEANITQLPAILRDIPSSQVEEMQSRLRCAAQHMFYSSSLGAIIGEDGRYDAFETIVEVLRVRRAHPDLPPERYAQTDQRFRDFIDCRLGGPDPQVLCAQGNERTYKDMPTCSQCHSQVVHRRTGSGFYSVAGGRICCTELRMAHCPRLW